jgi:acyl-CoA hydrolase
MRNPSRIARAKSFVLTEKCNTNDSIGGGPLYSLADKMAGIEAMEFTEGTCFTKYGTGLHLPHPAKKGEMLHVRAEVRAVFRTSLVMEALVFACRPIAQAQKRLVYKAMFLFVAVDPDEKKRSITHLAFQPQPGHEQQRYEQAVAWKANIPTVEEEDKQWKWED